MKKIIFERFNFYKGHNLSGAFKTIELLPTICFCINKQMEKGFEAEDEIYLGYVEYCLIFNWLGFYLEFELNIKTNKWIKDENSTN